MYSFLKISVISIVFLITSLFQGISHSIQNASDIKEPSLYALSACVMDGKSGRILYGKGEDEVRSNASTTKILTLIVTLENCDLDEVVSVSARAAAQPDVQLNMKEGEYYYLKDLCYSLMLESHNDSAVAIAEHVAASKNNREGTVEDFAVLMNEKAKEIGCQNSHFVTPNGLDDSDEIGNHSTCASDLALIMRYCVTQSAKRDEFLEITQTMSYSFSNLKQDENGNYSGGGRQFSCSNHNRLFSMVDGVLSGKTGYTNKAGYCYVCAVQQNDNIYIITLLGCGWPNHKTYKWTDTKNLLSFAKDNYEPVNLEHIMSETKIEEEFLVRQACVLNKEHRTKLEYIRRKTYSLYDCEEILARKDSEIKIQYFWSKEYQAPIKNGEELGHIDYYIDDELILQEKILSSKEVEKWNYAWVLQFILNEFL